MKEKEKKKQQKKQKKQQSKEEDYDDDFDEEKEEEVEEDEEEENSEERQIKGEGDGTESSKGGQFFKYITSPLSLLKTLFVNTTYQI